MILTHGANSLERGKYVEIGGRKYPVVKIGDQFWLAENLDYKFQGCGIGGTGLPNTSNAWYYDNDEATYGIDGTRKCGLLYNWYAVKLLNDNKSTLIPGWHVPTNNEWTILANTVGGSSTAGTKLKSANVTWDSGWNGTDDYAFSVLPAGGYSGSFGDVGVYAHFWTITEYSSNSADRQYFSSGASMNYYPMNKAYGLSVRLVKDAP